MDEPIICQCGRIIKNEPNEVVLYEWGEYDITYPNRTLIQIYNGKVVYAMCPHGESFFEPKDMYEWYRFFQNTLVHNHDLILGANEIRCRVCKQSMKYLQDETIYIPWGGDLLDWDYYRNRNPHRYDGYYDFARTGPCVLTSDNVAPVLTVCIDPVKKALEEKREKVLKYLDENWDKDKIYKLIMDILDEEKVSILDEGYECRWDCPSLRLEAAFI